MNLIFKPLAIMNATLQSKEGLTDFPPSEGGRYSSDLFYIQLIKQFDCNYDLIDHSSDPILG